MTGDKQAIFFKIIGNQGRFTVLFFIECGRLLGARAKVGKLPVIPHSLDQERPFDRLVLQAVREVQPGGIVRPESLCLPLGLGLGLGNAGLGFLLHRGDGLHGGFRHLLIGRDLRAPDKGRGVDTRRDAGIVNLRVLHPDD